MNQPIFDSSRLLDSRTIVLAYHCFWSSTPNPFKSKLSPSRADVVLVRKDPCTQLDKSVGPQNSTANVFRVRPCIKRANKSESGAGVEEEELKACVYVDLLPLARWDNTRWDLAFCKFELRYPTGFSPVRLNWLYGGPSSQNLARR